MKYFLFLTLILIIACNKEPKAPLSINGATMGTTYHISFIPFNEGQQNLESIQAGVEEVLEQVNASMSTYRSDSLISKINQSKADVFVPLDRHFQKVYEVAQQIHLFSQGHFDVTVGPAVNRWGFGIDEKQDPPSESELEEMKRYVGMNHVMVEGSRLKKDHLQVFLDFSAVAKGYAVDLVAKYFDSLQAKAYFIEIGGEVKVYGLKNNQPWKLGIETPTEQSRGLAKIIALSNMSVATSGDYRNFYLVADKKYSHTISPMTLKPVQGQLASVTVLDPSSCAKADAIATALMAMGEELAWKFVQDNKIAALLIVRNAQNWELKETPQFLSFLHSDN